MFYFVLIVETKTHFLPCWDNIVQFQFFRLDASCFKKMVEMFSLSAFEEAGTPRKMVHKTVGETENQGLSALA